MQSFMMRIATAWGTDRPMMPGPASFAAAH
jgi:hypothetical protein